MVPALLYALLHTRLQLGPFAIDPNVFTVVPVLFVFFLDGFKLRLHLVKFFLRVFDVLFNRDLSAPALFASIERFRTIDVILRGPDALLDGLFVLLVAATLTNLGGLVLLRQLFFTIVIKAGSARHLGLPGGPLTSTNTTTLFHRRSSLLS